VNGGASSSNVTVPFTSCTVFAPFHTLRLRTLHGMSLDGRNDSVVY
jgi:hypothetical protein